MVNTMTFMEKLEAKWAEGKYVCVGLDPDYAKIPEPKKIGRGFRKSEVEVLKDFNRGIIRDTHELVGAYKPNTAFYESYGAVGWEILQDTIHFIRERAPDVPIILDCKRGDIGNTNEHYARMAFDVMGADAITIHPYLGWEANRPFLDRADKGIFVLCRTSNPGAGEFQNLWCTSTGDNPEDDRAPLYVRVASHIADQKTWNKHRNCGLVTGATYPDEIDEVRFAAPGLPLLIPGIGKQGGDLEASVAAAKHRFLINSSSGIIFADDPQVEVAKLHAQIWTARVA